MRTFVLLVLAVGVLTGGASLVGLLADGLYRDNALVTAGWLGNDLVTLFVATPLLIVSAGRARHGSVRALLVSLGLLAYSGYNYAFYVFGAAFNALFLVYVAILAVSTVGLIAGLASSELRDVVAGVRVDRPARRVGATVAAIAGALGTFWLVSSGMSVVSGSVPVMVTATGHPTNVTGALDLWLVVTFGLWGGTWLALGRAWGFVISAIWTVKGAVYMTALSAASVAAARGGATESLAQLGLWVPIGVISAACAAVLLRGARLASQPSHWSEADVNAMP